MSFCIYVIFSKPVFDHVTKVGLEGGKRVLGEASNRSYGVW